jgi:poly(3-hydroxybutyrate) depolymerase
MKFKARAFGNTTAASLVLAVAGVLIIPALCDSPEPESVTLTKGLVISYPQGCCRSVLPLDPVAHRLVTGQWLPPRPGESLPLTEAMLASVPSAKSGESQPSSNTGPQRANWEAVEANEQGWFEHKALRCGYAYLTYEAKAPEVLILEGFAHDWVYVNGEPRVGNRYGQSDKYESWQPRFDFCELPVLMKSGLNEFLFKCARGRLKVRLTKPPKEIYFNIKDITAPDLIVGETTDSQAAIVVVNASTVPLSSVVLTTAGEGLLSQETPVPVILPLSVRKVAFGLRGSPPALAVNRSIELTLVKKVKNQTTVLDRTTISLRVVNSADPHKRTYVSCVDDSVQHYAILPARDVTHSRSSQRAQDQSASESSPAPGYERGAALVLSLHGANVEALNQVRSYAPKSWAHIVAPTNRRPYGFNWEDWGRLDALDVLAEAQKCYKTDPDRVYLTGHSMGGHGAWSVGGLFPDLFAAIGPSAGWISFWTYRARNAVETGTPLGQMIMRPFLPSDPYAVLKNYRQNGVYIIHGEKDESVPVTESRQMAAELQKIHRDFIYHEQPGAGHWWDASPEAGVDCVDWPPLFDFFARRTRPGPERVREIEFATPCPGVSASCNWLTIEAQSEPLKISSVRIRVSPDEGLFSGSTENVSRLSIDLSPWETKETLRVDLDGQKIEGILWPNAERRLWLSRRDGRWEVIPKPAAALKGPHRYGLFKDAFKNRVLLVFGTRGNREEKAWAAARARFDAETFWYQGNGSVDVIPDSEFTPARYADRNVILYGHTGMNSAWRTLLPESPVQVRRGKLQAGKQTLEGRDLACLLIRPRPASDIASVGVVAGTGIIGLRLTETLPYLYAGYSFPDIFIARPALLTEGNRGVEAIGFFGPDWGLEFEGLIWSSIRVEAPFQIHRAIHSKRP